MCLAALRMPKERSRGQPGENHTSAIVGAFSKNSRRADEANESHAKKARYNSVLEPASSEGILTDDSAGSVDGDTVVSEHRSWRSFVSAYKPKIRMGTLDVKPANTDEFIRLHYKGSSEDSSEWELVIEHAKGFKKRLDIRSAFIKELQYADKVLLVTPTPEFAKELVTLYTESTGDGHVFLDPESSNDVLHRIIFSFHNVNQGDGETFIGQIAEKLKSGKISAKKIANDQAEQYMKSAINAGLHRSKAITQLTQVQPQPSQTHVEISVTEEKCPDVLIMNVQVLGVGQFQGQHEMVHISQHKTALYIVPDKYIRPVAGVWIEANRFEFYQLEVAHGFLYMPLKNNYSVEIAARLLKMAENKDLMDSNTKLRGSALRMWLGEDVNLTWVTEILDNIGVPAEKVGTLDQDFVRKIFTGIKTAPRGGMQINTSSVRGPLDSCDATVNTWKGQPPPKRPPQMVMAPTNNRQPNGNLQQPSFNLPIFEQARNQPPHKKTLAAVNSRMNKNRTVNVPYGPRQTTRSALKENNEPRLRQTTLPLPSRSGSSPGTTFSEGQGLSNLTITRLGAKKNNIVITSGIGTKKVTKLIIDTKYLPAPLKKSILDALIERMEKRKTSNTPRQLRSRNAITAAYNADNDTIVPNNTGASLDPVCIDLSDDDEANTSGSVDISANAFIAECPDGAHEIFRNLHSLEPVKLGNGQMCANDLFHLAKGQQLGDGVVEFILEFHRMSLPKNSGIHVFSYFFFQSYQNLVARENQPFTCMSDVMHKRLSDYSNKVDLFGCRYLVIPILKDQHWFLAIVCSPDPLSDAEVQQTPCVAILDSLVSSGVNPRHKETFALIQCWLEKEYETKTGQKHSFGPKAYPTMVVAIPQQQNGVDCGVFMLTACQYFLENPPIFYPKKTPNEPFSGRSPKVPRWFGSGSNCVQKMRLQFLHWYYCIAAWKRFFVYRDDYIPTLIAEVGKENDLLAAAFADSSKSPSDSETESHGSPKTPENNQPQPSVSTPAVKPDLVKLYQDVQMLNRHGLLSPAEKEYYVRSGYLPTEGQLKQKTYTAAEKLKILLERKAQRKAEAAARQSVERSQTAEEMYEEYMKSS